MFPTFPSKCPGLKDKLYRVIFRILAWRNSLRSKNNSLIVKVLKRISHLQGMKILGKKKKKSTKIEAGPTWTP